MATATQTAPTLEVRVRHLTGGELLPYVLILLAHAPLLYVHLQQLWGRPHYQFFPLVLLASGWMIWTRAKDRKPPVFWQFMLSRGLLLISVCLLTLAFLKLSPLGCYLSFFAVTASLILRLGIPAIGPWALLLLLIRIPYGQDVALIQWMQRLTTRLSSTALDTIRVEHIVDGNILSFPGQSLFVEEACSGVVSMLAIVACAAIIAVWWKRSLWHGIVLIAAGLFWAGGMNVVRVVAIAIALDRYGIDLTAGWRHETVGLCVFAVSLLALLSTDRLLLFLFGPIRLNPLASYWVYAEDNRLIRLWNVGAGSDTDEHAAGIYGEYAEDWANPVYDEPDEASPGQRSRWSEPVDRPRPWEWAFAAGFFLLGGAQVYAGIGPFSVAPPVRQTALNLSDEALPHEWGGWTKVNFESRERDGSSVFGEHSRMWTYRQGPYLATLSVDFVFPEWHELTACYEGTGWTAESRSRLHDEGTCTTAMFSKPSGEQAFLVFDLFDSDGSEYVSPEGSFMHPQLRRIMSGHATRFTLPTYYQVQTLVGLPGEDLPPQDREIIVELFKQFDVQIRELVTGHPPQQVSGRPTTTAGAGSGEAIVQ